MPVQTLAQLFLASVGHNKRDYWLAKTGGGWRPVSPGEAYRRVARLHLALARIGLRRGDACGLLSENRWEWAATDFALMTAGIVSVPLYPTLTADQLHYMLENSGARAVFVSTAAQRQKIESVWRRLPVLDNMVCFEDATGGPTRRIFPIGSLMGQESLSDQDRKQFESAAAAVGPYDLASIIYTSGTTGVPKGVMLTHANLVSNVLDSNPDFRPDDLGLSFLPLCHVFERTLDYAYYLHGIPVAHVASSDAVAQALSEVRPTLVAAVPRFFEKSYQRVMERMAAAPPLRRRLFDWALMVGYEATAFQLERRPMPLELRIRLALARKLVFSKLRARLGGRIRHFYSGAAPLERELIEFFFAAGLPIYEGYGLTETSPVVAMNRPEAVRFGAVGKPIRNVQVRLADDGEVLVRGPNVMKGYYKMDKATAEAIRDGWLHTGDIGHLDSDGYLSIIDRKKDLLKTSGGKYIAPQPIENKLRNNPYIGDAVVIAEHRRFPGALIVPNFASVEQAAKQNGVTCASSAELARHPWVVGLLEQEVKKTCLDLAPYEQIKRIAVLGREFSIDAGEITPTMKVRRREVERRYADVIDRMYKEEAIV